MNQLTFPTEGFRFGELCAKLDLRGREGANYQQYLFLMHSGITATHTHPFVLRF